MKKKIVALSPSKFWVGQQLLCWCWDFQRLSVDQSQSRLKNNWKKICPVDCELVNNWCLIFKQKVKKIFFEVLFAVTAYGGFQYLFRREEGAPPGIGFPRCRPSWRWRSPRCTYRQHRRPDSENSERNCWSPICTRNWKVLWKMINCSYLNLKKIITTTHLLKVSIKSTKTFSYLISKEDTLTGTGSFDRITFFRN